MPKLQKRQLVTMGVILLLLLLYGAVQPTRSLELFAYPEVTISQIEIAPIAIRSSSVPDPITTAQAVYITDERSGARLFEKNASTFFAPASTTKLMTALVAKKVFVAGSVLKVPSNTKYEGTIVGLTGGEELTIEDLLRGAIIQSGNDAATVIAENFPGGEVAFVAEMNQTAKLLHMDNTYFNNPSGFDNQLHQTTARDLAILSREVLKDQFLSELVATKSALISDVSGLQKHLLYNTNQLLKEDSRIVGVKTGTTEEAGQVLITAVNDKGRRFIIVVLASEDRYADTRQLIDWVLHAYTWYDPTELLEELKSGAVVY